VPEVRQLPGQGQHSEVGALLRSVCACAMGGGGGGLDLGAGCLPDGGRRGGCDVCTLPPPAPPPPPTNQPPNINIQL
jgi:hypothetical protein